MSKTRVPQKRKSSAVDVRERAREDRAGVRVQNDKGHLQDKERSECTMSSSHAPSTSHFYLHRPNVPARFKCLIPVQSSASIAEMLQDKVVLEFPTIFVREDSSARLSEPFILEADYLNVHDTATTVKLPTYGGNAETKGEQRPSSPLVDKKRLFEVLQKDLSSCSA